MKLETEWIKIIEVVGVPAVAAGGLGYLVWVLFKSLIRIDAMCRSVLGMKPDVERIARADGRKDQRKD